MSRLLLYGPSKFPRSTVESETKRFTQVFRPGWARQRCTVRSWPPCTCGSGHLWSISCWTFMYRSDQFLLDFWPTDVLVEAIVIIRKTVRLSARDNHESWPNGAEDRAEFWYRPLAKRHHVLGRVPLPLLKIFIHQIMVESKYSRTKTKTIKRKQVQTKYQSIPPKAK